MVCKSPAGSRPIRQSCTRAPAHRSTPSRLLKKPARTRSGRPRGLALAIDHPHPDPLPLGGGSFFSTLLVPKLCDHRPGSPGLTGCCWSHYVGTRFREPSHDGSSSRTPCPILWPDWRIRARLRLDSMRGGRVGIGPYDAHVCAVLFRCVRCRFIPWSPHAGSRSGVHSRRVSTVKD